jgi:hypothetical protein
MLMPAAPSREDGTVSTPVLRASSSAERTLATACDIIAGPDFAGARG